MRFFALLPVRDEADIIGQCLQASLQWADQVYVFDTGSVDDTWEIVLDVAAQDSRVRPLRKDPVFFSETRLRGWMFEQARKDMHNGDWFLRIDADEFHHVSPPEFVKTRLREHETIVYHQYYNFCLRTSEVNDWENGRETLADRARPIEDRRRWYVPSIYSEPRLCRYRRTMQWPPTVSFPFNAGFLAVDRLPIRHYPYRDPPQVERRCRLRAVMMADKENRQNWSQPELHHWAEAEWRKFMTPDDQPDLQFWERGSELPEISLTNHLSKRSVRVAQKLAHRFMLPLLDRQRAAWPEEAYPQQIAPQTVALLEDILSVEPASQSGNGHGVAAAPREASAPPIVKSAMAGNSRAAGKFVCILAVRDEGDIIEQCLTHLLSWADEVNVFDTGSVDATWDIVQDFATRDARIKPLRHDSVFFSQARVRGWIFQQARQHMRNGDWFLRVDADEVHHVSPREFVKTRLAEHETIVYHQYYNFCLLQSEVANWEAGRETIADRARPIEERRRWYRPSIYSEPRLCRYRRTMQWPPTTTFPHNAGYRALARLPIRHYPHRDPVQLARRCQLRVLMMADGTRIRGHHWSEREWRKLVTPDGLDDLRFWSPGTELPTFHYTQHLAPPPVRMLQRFTHACMLPVLDRIHSGWPDHAYPQPIPPQMVAELQAQLKQP